MNFKKIILILLLILPGLTNCASMPDWKKFVTKRNALYFSVASGCVIALWKLTRAVPETPKAPAKEANDQDVDTFLRLLNFNPNSEAAQQFRADVERKAKAGQAPAVAIDPQPSIAHDTAVHAMQSQAHDSSTNKKEKLSISDFKMLFELDSPEASNPNAKVADKPAAVPAVPVAPQAVSTRGASAGAQSSAVDDDRNIKRGLDEAVAAKGMSESQTFERVEIPVTTQAISELQEEILRNLKSNMELVRNIKRFNEGIKYFQDNLGKLEGGADTRRIYADKLVQMQGWLNNPNFPWNKGRVIALLLKDPKLAKESLDAIKKDPASHKQAIVDLEWYFYFGQDFDDGSFSVDDADDAFFNFILSHPDVYERISTHNPEDKAQHYGLDTDIKSSDGSKTYLELPNGKRHILFHKKLNGYTFMKAESHGVKSWSDLFHHTIELGFSLANKMTPGADDKDEYRKERVDAGIAAAWKNLITKFFPNEKAKYIEEGKKGIGAMCQLLKNPDVSNLLLNSDGSVAHDDAIVGFVTCLSQHERSLQDSLAISARRGREVIILRKDIK